MNVRRTNGGPKGKPKVGPPKVTIRPSGRHGSGPIKPVTGISGASGVGPGLEFWVWGKRAKKNPPGSFKNVLREAKGRLTKEGKDPKRDRPKK